MEGAGEEECSIERERERERSLLLLLLLFSFLGLTQFSSLVETREKSA